MSQNGEIANDFYWFCRILDRCLLIMMMAMAMAMAQAKLIIGLDAIGLAIS